MSETPDPWLDAQLRQVPLPPGLLERLRKAGEITDADIDDELRNVAIPGQLSAQLLAIPTDEAIAQRLSDVTVPDGLIDDLLAIPIDQRLNDVAVPAGLLSSLRQVPPRKRRRLSLGQLALAASLLLMITASYLASLSGMMLTAYDQWPEDRIARFSLTDSGIDLSQPPTVDEAVAFVPLDDATPDRREEPWVDDSLVNYPVPASVPTTPLMNAQWLVPAGGSFADNYLPLKYGLLGEPRRDEDSVPDLELFTPSPPRGIDIPLMLGFDRQYLITNQTQPRVNFSVLARLPESARREALSRLATSQVPLWTKTDSYDLTRQMTQEGKLPEPWQIHVEDFLAAADYRFAPAEVGELAIRAAAGPSPFGEDHAQLMQVGIQAGDAPRMRSTHLIAVVDVSESMQWDDRLDLIKTALRRLTNSLGRDDAFSLVAFNERATTLVERITLETRDEIPAIVDSLVAEGGTNFGAGLLEAGLLAHAGAPGKALPHLVVFTDGAPPRSSATRQATVQLIEELVADGARFSVADVNDSADGDETWRRLTEIGRGEFLHPSSAEELQWRLHELITGHSPQVAVDANVEVRFNPRSVAAYRLIGHEPVTSGGLESAGYRHSLSAGQAATALYEVWLLPTGEEKVADITISWKDANGDRTRTRRQRISRLQFVPSIAEMPLPLITAALAAETAEILRQSPAAETGRSRDVRPVLDLAEWTNPTLAERPAFQRLIETVERVDAVRRRQPLPK